MTQGERRYLLAVSNSSFFLSSRESCLCAAFPLRRRTGEGLEGEGLEGDWEALVVDREERMGYCTLLSSKLVMVSSTLLVSPAITLNHTTSLLTDKYIVY